MMVMMVFLMVGVLWKGTTLDLNIGPVIVTEDYNEAEVNVDRVPWSGW